jgi:biopolymer transport protein TolR
MHTERKDGEGMHEVNVVPLIDVSLVLVVILMLLTPLASESSIAVHRAHADSSPATAADPPEPVTLLIPDDSTVVVKGVAVARAELGASITPLLVGDDPPPVVVTCAPNVMHGSFVNVLDIAKLCGAKQIAIADGGR